MRRRALLASALTAVLPVTAGCNAVERRTEHTNPVVKTSDNPRDDEKYLEFQHDGTVLATVGVDPRFAPSPEHFHTWISHAENTELQSLTQRFVPLDGDGTPPKLSLEGPFMGSSRPHPSVSLFRDGSAAVVEVHRFGDLADQSVFIDFPVVEWPEPGRRVFVESTVELVQSGVPDRTHVLDGRFEFDAETDGTE